MDCSIAEKGDAQAQLHLGLKYTVGTDVPKDETEAVKWFRKAADQGVAMAQYNLGVRYANGEGIPKDAVQAYAWVNLGTATLESAKQLKAAMEKDFTPAQVAEGQALSRELAKQIEARKKK